MSHTSASPGGAPPWARPDGSPTRATRCPHCRHFREPYDEVARTFNQGHGGEGEAAKVLIARVDCVANHELCSGLMVKGYPTIWWGSLESTVAVLGAIAEGKTGSWPGNKAKILDAPPGLSKVAGRTSQRLGDANPFELGGRPSVCFPEAPRLHRGRGWKGGRFGTGHHRTIVHT